MKVKIEVKSLNNYPPLPPTHTHLGRGLLRLTLHPRTIIHGCERTSDSLNEGLPIKMTREKFQRK